MIRLKQYCPCCGNIGSPRQFIGLLEEHRKLQQSHIALDARRHNAEIERAKALARAEQAEADLTEERARRRDAQSVDHCIACDRQYVAGLKEGWNLGCCDNRAGLAQAVAARKLAIHAAIDAARRKP
jgi:hypothetical protein